MINSKKNKCARKTFGLLIRMKRFELNMTQEELSEKSNMHPTYLGSIERGQRNPTLEKIISLAKALNCSAKDLMPEMD